MPIDTTNLRQLTQSEVDQLPEGSHVILTWPGGNGPHRYRVKVGTYYGSGPGFFADDSPWVRQETQARYAVIPRDHPCYDARVDEDLNPEWRLHPVGERRMDMRVWLPDEP